MLYLILPLRRPPAGRDPVFILFCRGENRLRASDEPRRESMAPKLVASVRACRGGQPTHPLPLRWADQNCVTLGESLALSEPGFQHGLNGNEDPPTSSRSSNRVWQPPLPQPSGGGSWRRAPRPALTQVPHPRVPEKVALGTPRGRL